MLTRWKTPILRAVLLLLFFSFYSIFKRQRALD